MAWPRMQLIGDNIQIYFNHSQQAVYSCTGIIQLIMLNQILATLTTRYLRGKKIMLHVNQYPTHWACKSI